MRVGILAHSRHLQVKNWEKMMWGDPPNLLGQFPKAILTALQEDAEIMVLGCGLRSGFKGEMESEFNWQYILDHFCNLSEFAEFRGVDLKKARERIEQILVLDKLSLNTIQEIAFAGKIFENAGIEKVIGITAPTHNPRCSNGAIIFYSRPESKILLSNISVQSSDVGWASNNDVVVLEPPHRPDDKTGESRMKIAKLLFQPDIVIKIVKALGL